MARFSNGVRLKQCGERPKPIHWTGLYAQVEEIQAVQFDDNSILLAPLAYLDDPDDSLEADWRNEYDATRCWKTTVIYEQIDENHPHLVPCTALPVLTQPSGPALTKFIHQHRATLYNGPQYAPTTRLQLSFLPLAYQWALHIISGLEFIHSHEVVLGNLDLTNCWLASDPRSSLSLVGFLNAGFKYVKQWSALYAADQDQNDWKGFLPLGHYRNAPVTRQTDLFWYGCTVYELMTGSWPATQDSLMRIRECTVEELAGMFTTRGWPVLETEYMGAIVHRCWNDEYASAEEVKAAVRSFLQGLGWEVEGNDDLKGFYATDLFPQEQQ